jgi:hypothetical protein
LPSQSLRRDSIYTQTYDEQQIKWRMNWRNPQGTGTVREMRALYTTDHCDSESVKILSSRYNAQKTGESVLVCMRACVFMRVHGDGTKGASIDRYYVVGT